MACEDRDMDDDGEVDLTDLVGCHYSAGHVDDCMGRRYAGHAIRTLA